MMSLTHAAIAVSTVSISLGSAEGAVLATALMGSQLPDLDTSESFAGRALYPLSRWLETHYPHRSVTHSFLATGAIAVASSPLLTFCHWHYWVALVTGHFTGWFADSFTKSGVACFFPSTARMVIPGNPRARLRSQSPAEYWVLAIACLLAIISVNLSSAGGVSEQFGRAFFSDTATAAGVFHKYGSSQKVMVQVEGMNIATSQRVSGVFVVLEANDRDLVAEDSTGRIYKIGTAPDANIQPLSIKTQLGDKLTIAAQEQSLQEVAVSDWLKRLPQNAYLSGSLLLDDMADVQIPIAVSSYRTLRVFGGQLELSNARPGEVSAVLGQFWILTGKVLVRTRL